MEGTLPCDDVLVMVSMKIFMMKIQIFQVIVCKVALFTYHFILKLDLDLDALLHELETEDDFDFTPFPNKLFALLYCLLNSPKPMVSFTKVYIFFNREKVF